MVGIEIEDDESDEKKCARAKGRGDSYECEMRIVLSAHIALLLSFNAKALNFLSLYIYIMCHTYMYDIFKCQTKGGQCRMNTTFISHWLSSALTPSK